MYGLWSGKTSFVDEIISLCSVRISLCFDDFDHSWRVSPCRFLRIQSRFFSQVVKMDLIALLPYEIVASFSHLHRLRHGSDHDFEVGHDLKRRRVQRIQSHLVDKLFLLDHSLL